MSHFTVLVIGDDVEKQLAPYHEFECTGVDDEHVKDVDRTDEVREHMADGACSLEAALEYFGLEDRIVAAEEQVDRDGKHKYGYAVVDDGRLIKAVRRTNPDKWLWKDSDGREIAVTHGDENLPFVREEPGRGGEFLLDEPGRLVHVLQILHAEKQSRKTEYQPASSLAHEVDVRHIAGGVRSDDCLAGSQVPDLRDRVEDGLGRLRGGPLPQDQCGSSDTLHELQSSLGASQRRCLDPRSVEVVHPPLRKHLISGTKWDWWVVGGRWSGFLRLKTDGAPRYADAAKKGEVDFHAMRGDAVKLGMDLYSKFHAVVAGREIPSWKAVREKHGVANIDAARAEFHANPVVKDLNAAREFLFLNFDDFAVPAADYAKRLADGAVATHAVVKDGKWYESGSMGWWGVVHDAKDAGEWNAQFAALLDGLPDDAMLTVVDCHI